MVPGITGKAKRKAKSKARDSARIAAAMLGSGADSGADSKGADSGAKARFLDSFVRPQGNGADGKPIFGVLVFELTELIDCDDASMAAFSRLLGKHKTNLGALWDADPALRFALEAAAKRLDAKRRDAAKENATRAAKMAVEVEAAFDAKWGGGGNKSD